MTQIDLIQECLRQAQFDGITYDPSLDYQRLSGQLKRVFSVMIKGGWYTLSEIAAYTGDHSEAAISARLRDLRKPKFGAFQIERQRRGDAKRGLWEYRLK
jgi:hypothetical protein